MSSATALRRVVKSRSNRELVDEGRKFAAQYPEVNVVIPSRLAGEGLANGDRGSLGLHRATLTQWAATLARPAMAERGLVPLSGLGLEAVAARVVHRVNLGRQLKYYSPVSSLPGFARALARTLGDLRMAGVTPEAVSRCGAAGADLGLLLREYQGELMERSFADTAAVFRLACEAEPPSLPLLWFDAPRETEAHRDLFERLTAAASAVLIALSSTQNFQYDGGIEDLDAGAPSTSLERLRRYLFLQDPPAPDAEDDAFDIFSAPGEGLEAAEIARRILRLTDQGFAFDQMAILLRNPDRYQPVIEEALRRAQIPGYFSHGSSRPDAAGRAFLALLQCAVEKCSASRFAEYLSLGQVPQEEAKPRWVAPQGELFGLPEVGADSPGGAGPERQLQAPHGWEKLLVDAAVIGGRDRWARRLAGLEREFELRLEDLGEDDEAGREHLTRQLQRLHNLGAFALPLIETLDGLPRSAPWEEWLDSLERLATMALRNPDGVVATLAEFAPMGEVGPVTVEEVAEVLSDRLRFLRAEPPQRRWGRVFVGSIEESRGGSFRAVFLPGLAEGLFPQRMLEDPLLLDADRAQVSAALPQRSHRVSEERERLHLAVAAAGERFIVSYPRMDVAEARPRVPSFYALELPKAREGALPKLKEFERRTREAAAARLNWPAPKTTADAIDDAEYDLVKLSSAEGARYLVEANANLARTLRSRWARWRGAWKEVDGLITHNAEALKVLGEARLAARVWSPSSLEQFAVCPYKFALNGIHRLRPREEAAPIENLDPLTRGALFHEVQFTLLSELREAESLPVTAENLPGALRAMDRTLERIAAKYQEELAPAIFRVWKADIEDLRTDLRGWLQQVAQNDGDWQPLYFEFAFGLAAGLRERDPASTEEEASLAEGVRLRGSIDLVEKHVRTGALRVTDHKTGRAPERIPAYVGGGRVLQPLLYALVAEQKLHARVESGRLFYATQRGSYQQVGIPVSDRSRAFLAKLLANVDDAIGSGFLPPVPEKGACALCDYRAVCGPYEEQRASQYKNRREDRLEGLTEIRGFL
ncbi:MAG TPA: PD-(D/E)XK nuclease family protein [Bryobacteraceae bacterium]|jgi:CRISPR/Cas system-associated exonuclease Cas4 (RecB family)